MTASFTLLVLSSKDRGASSPSILYPKEESGSHCLLIFVLKPRSAGLKFGSTIFIAKLYISRKEAGETIYWIDLLKESGYLSDDVATSISDDCNELLKLLTSSIKTMKGKQAPRN